MKQELPSPDEILAELAEGVVAQIDARAVTSFEKNLDDMTAYHRFLVSAYSGDNMSYADLEESYLPIHREWLRPYRQIIERAIAMLDEEPSFFSTICHLPHKLSRGREDRSSRSMQHAIMGLAPLIVFRLEKWFTKRAARTGGLVDDEITLKGSDRSTHEDAVFDFVGAWESFRHWGDLAREEGQPADRWKAAAQSWEILGEHLALTAEVFAIATWNGDVLAASRFRDMLVRWSDNLGLGFNRPYYLERPEFLQLDLLAMDWRDVLARVRPDSDNFPDEGITPEGLYFQLVQNAHRQAVVTAAGVLVRWSIAERSGSLALGEASALLTGDTLDDAEGRLGHAESLASFPILWRTLVATVLAGSYHSGGAHSQFLDHLATSLDRVSERKVTTGRVYTPSTIHDRSGLNAAYWALLNAYFGSHPQNTLAWTQELLRADGLTHERVKARRVREFLRRLAEASLPVETQINVSNGLGLSQLDPSQTAFANFLAEAQAFADDLDKERILAAAIDPDELAIIRRKIVEELPNAEVSLFEPVVTLGEGGDRKYTRRFNMDKAALLSLESGSPRIGSWVAKSMSEVFAPHPWWDFLKLKKVPRKSATDPSRKAFWSLALRLSQTLAGDTGLWLRRSDIEAFHAAFDEADRAVAGITPTRSRGRFTYNEGYAFSLGSMHVFGRDGEDGEAILFSLNSLTGVEFGITEPDIELTVHPSDEGPLKVVLECSIAYRLHWADTKAYRLWFQASGGASE